MKGFDYNRLKGYVLPGRDPKDEFTASIICGAIWAAVTDIPIFFMRYFGVMNAVKMMRSGRGDEYSPYMEMVCYPPTGPVEMPGLSTLTYMCLWGIHIYVIYRVIKAIYDMFYFTRGTKSAYVMARLDERWPIVRRCWTKAIAGIIAALIAGLILYLINYLVYIGCTPGEYVPKTAGASFFRALFGGEI